MHAFHCRSLLTPSVHICSYLLTLRSPNNRTLDVSLSRTIVTLELFAIIQTGAFFFILVSSINSENSEMLLSLRQYLLCSLCFIYKFYVIRKLYVVKCLYFIHKQLRAASVVKSAGKYDMGAFKRHTHIYVCIYIYTYALSWYSG